MVGFYVDGIEICDIPIGKDDTQDGWYGLSIGPGYMGTKKGRFFREFSRKVTFFA